MANRIPHSGRPNLNQPRPQAEREALTQLKNRQKSGPATQDQSGKLLRQPGEKTWSQTHGLPSRLQAGQYRIEFFQEGCPQTITVKIADDQQIVFSTGPNRFQGQILTNLLYWIENFHGKFKIKRVQPVSGLPDLKT